MNKKNANTKYRLVGDKYIERDSMPRIKGGTGSREYDRVYWKDLHPYERVTEKDVKREINPEYWDDFLTWDGCGRAILANKRMSPGLEHLYSDWGYDHYVYHPCSRKVHDNYGFCKAHLKSAMKDGVPADWRTENE